MHCYESLYNVFLFSIFSMEKSHIQNRSYSTRKNDVALCIVDDIVQEASHWHCHFPYCQAHLDMEKDFNC